jgi:hypothetical protein
VGRKGAIPGIVFKKISAPLLPPPKPSAAASFFLPKTPFPQRVRDPIFPNLFQVLQQPHQTNLSTPSPNRAPNSLGLPLARLIKFDNTPWTLRRQPHYYHYHRHHNHLRQLQPPVPHYVNRLPPQEQQVRRNATSSHPRTTHLVGVFWVWSIQRRAITCNGHSLQ